MTTYKVLVRELVVGINALHLNIPSHWNVPTRAPDSPSSLLPCVHFATSPSILVRRYVHFPLISSEKGSYANGAPLPLEARLETTLPHHSIVNLPPQHETTCPANLQ